MNDEIEIVRRNQPEVEPVTEQARAEMRQRLDEAIMREIPRKAKSRSWRRSVVVLAGAVMLAGAGGLIASLLPADRTGAPDVANAVEVERRPDGTIRVTFVDVTDATAEQINSELTAADVPVRIHLVPGSPSLVGHIAAVWQRPGPDVVGGQALIQLGNEFRGPFGTDGRFRKLNGLDIDTVDVEAPFDYFDVMSLDLWVVRPATEDERYVVRRDSAERSDEALDCTSLYNLPAMTAREMLEDREITVIWQTSDIWNSHDLLVSHLEDSIDANPPFATINDPQSDGDQAPLDPRHAEWRVWYTTPVAPGVVAVRIGPSAQTQPDAQPITTIRGARGVGPAVPVPDDSGSTASGFVRPDPSAGSFRRFVIGASKDQYPEAGCADEPLQTARVRVGPGSLSM